MIEELGHFTGSGSRTVRQAAGCRRLYAHAKEYAA